MQEYKQCNAHYEHWFASKQMQIHCNLLGVTAVNMLVDKEPSAKPLLVTITIWKSTDGEVVQIPTLLDTGCNTSIIHSSLIGKLLSVDGTVPKVKIKVWCISSDNFCQSDMERTTPQRKRLLYSFDRASLDLPNSPQTVWYGWNQWGCVRETNQVHPRVDGFSFSFLFLS